MFRNTYAGLLAAAALVACGEARDQPAVHETPSDHSENPPIGEPHSDPGGSSGSEGSLLPCEETATALATPEAQSQIVGLSLTDLLELANRQTEIAVRWPALDGGPTFERSASTIEIHVTAASDARATEYVCNDPNFPVKYRPKPRVEVPIAVTLQTADGALDLTFETVLSATQRGRAEIAAVTLEAAAGGGSIARAVTSFYTAGTRSLLIYLSFGPNGPEGAVMGPFSPHAAAPCAYTTYAYWPEDSACWPDRSGEPVDDSDAMQPHLARVNRTFDLSWDYDKGERTRATFEVKLAAGATCDANENLSHPVEVRIATADGRVDVRLPAMLSGGPSTIDPWPAKLRNVEPFSLDLSGTIALDATGLADQLGIHDPNVSAGILTVYLSSPSGNDSPVLSGRLRVVTIDRTGFATPLPSVALPGGDSEHCFSRGAGAQILDAKIDLN